MKGLAVLVVACFGLVFAAACVATPPAAAPAPTPVSPGETAARAWAEALGDGDVDAILALWVDDGMEFRSADFTTTSREQFRVDGAEFMVGLGGAFDVEECVPGEAETRCRMLARNLYLQAVCGEDVAEFEVAIKLKDGKIQSWTETFPAEVKQACEVGEPKAFYWAQANRPDDLAKLNQLNGRAAGELLATMYKAYLESEKD